MKNSIYNKFYVYALYRLDGTPFYIGKGCGARWLHHEKESQQKFNSSTNKLKTRIIRKIQATGNIVPKQKLAYFVDEQAAFDYEKFLILSIGMRVRSTGPLANLSFGGEGQQGYRHKQSTKDKIGAASKGEKNPAFGKGGTFKGMKHTEEHKQYLRERYKGEGNPMYGKTVSEETKEKLRKASKERPRTDEERAKRSVMMKGEGNPMFGKTASLETRIKMSEARRRFLERKALL